MVLFGGFTVEIAFGISFWLLVVHSVVLCSCEQLRQHGGALQRPAVWLDC